MNQQFTGRHFLLIMLAFFGVIISVNITMAVLANTSWTGFVVRNSYVAGLEMNRKLREGREQAALEWSGEMSSGDGFLRYALADAHGKAVPMRGGKATFNRPVSDAEDMALVLAPDSDGVLDAPLLIGDGVWIVHIEADAGLDKAWRQSYRITVRNGEIQ